MVLAELGSKITGALAKMANSTVVDASVLDELLEDISQALLSSDVNVSLVQKLRHNVLESINFEELPAGVNKRGLVQKTIIQEIVNLLDPGKTPYKPKRSSPNVVMFVGLQGSGKTTTCTKYAYYYRRRGWKTALVCADTFRAGAFDQLKQNATKAGIPFYGSYTETDPVAIAEEGVRKFKEAQFEVIIVDTSGRHKQESALFDEMEQVSSVVEPDDIVFVMDSSIGQAAYDQAEAFGNRVAVGSVIITKMDGHAKGGGALSAVAATKSPITFLGTGEHIDEFDTFEARSFVSRLLGMGDVGGLLNMFKDVGMEGDMEKAAERMMQGQFNLKDMRIQMQNVMKMGPISKVMGMIPGFSQELIPKGQEKEGQKRLKAWLVLMDSMSAQELENPKLIDASRTARIARGSGTSIRAVNELMEQYRRFSKVVGKMGKMKLPQNLGNANEMNQFANMNAGNLAKMVDPRMLKQMGGVSGFANMMKQMGSGGGMPGMPGMM